MWHTFLYTLRMMIRQNGVIIWVIIFPLVLSTLFAAMFKNIETASFQLDPVACAVVDDGAYQSSDNAAFGQMIDVLGASGDDHLLDVTYVDDTDEANALIQDGSILGYYVLDAEGTPSLVLAPNNDPNSIEAISQTVLKDVADEYIHARLTITNIVQTDPAALADSSVIEGLYDHAGYTQQISITANPSAQSIRYFYALLGFAALMSSMIALQAIIRSQPNLSAVGARRAISAVNRGKTLVGTLLASWALSFGCLVVAFLYMRFVLSVDFGGRDADCILGIFVASLMATSFGACIGAIPKIADGAKGGILTAVTCFMSLFAGLYGTPSLNLADQISRAVPWITALNPVKKAADLFYSLYFYTSLEPFREDIVILLATTFVFTAIAALFMRRQRYASL